MSPNPNPPGTPPPQMPKNPTIIFDYRDAPLDPEELAAIQAMKKLRRLTSLKTRSRKNNPNPSPAVGLGQISPQDREQKPAQPDPTPDPIPAPPEPQRKKGGQPDNTNALKYGFYSRRIPQRELDGLDETAVTSLKDEIDVMRVFSRKVAELGANVDDLEEATSLLRVLSLATSSINRLVRTHTRIPDPELDPAWLLKTALLELEEEWPELKAFGDKYRNKPGNPSRDSEDT